MPCTKPESPFNHRKRLGRLLFPFLVLVGLVGAVSLLEGYLSLSATESAQPNYQRLAAAHAPFSQKYPHPAYGFFLPTDSALLAHFESDILHVSARGFRGPGPPEANQRKLAFLVGNSVVFGFAPNDSLTITGFLNRAQDEFFFVNAGVPSWVSRQMRDRTLKELLAYHPSLIIFWGGHNDASLAFRAARDGQPFTPDLVEQPDRSQGGIHGALKKLVPNLTTLFVRFSRAAGKTKSPRIDSAVARAAADAFIENVRAAFAASSTAGVTFAAVYQPILHHHHHRPPGSVPEDERAFFEYFRARALAEARNAGIPLLDLSTCFDDHFETVPVFTAGSGPDLQTQVFVDRVHLYVPGNRLVAFALSNYLLRLGERSSG